MGGPVSPSSKWIDLEDPILFSVQFRHTPTHRGSLAELAKSLASYVSGSRSRYVGRGGTLCKEERVVESADAVHFHVGTTGIRSRPAVHGSWTALAGPAPLRRRRRAEMLVGGHVRCDCERHGTLIENRSTTVHAQSRALRGRMGA